MEGLIKLADGLVTLDMQVSRKPADLVVIVPSRGRPEAAMELARSFADTITLDTRILLAVNADDPTLREYAIEAYRVPTEIIYVEASTMVEALNQAAVSLCIPESWNPDHYKNFPPPYAVGFMGDDHRPRTKGWDEKYVSALRELRTGIVYGDDLLQGERLPTQCAMTVDIVQALGFMAPPMLKHMYVDDFWRDLGTTAGCLKYLCNVVVEHMHPAAGKAEMDDSYLRVNNSEVYTSDGKAYWDYKNSENFRSAIEQIRSLKLAGSGALTMPVEMPPGDVFWNKEAHEWRLFEEGTVPEYTRPEWYAGREHAPHLEQGGGHRERLLCSASLVAQAAFTLKKNTVVDLGCGDGGLLSLLGPAMSAWGYDLMDENVEAAKGRGVDVRYGDVVDGDIEWGSIAVCTEMLEHLVDPHAFLRRIAARCSAIVCSSPWDERPGSAYEYHTWAWDLDGYRALVEQAGFKVNRQRTASRFQVILAIKP